MVVGGTESIILAMLAYKMQGLAKGITSPEVICATSAHGALDKVRTESSAVEHATITSFYHLHPPGLPLLRHQASEVAF